MIDHETVAPIIQSVAGVVRRMYPVVDRGDLEGAQWEWVYSNPAKVKNYLSADATGLLTNRLRSVAQRFAAAENEIVQGRNPEDFAPYSPRVVGELLKDVFSYEDWQPSGQFGDGMPTAKRLANTTGDRMAMLADVKVALEKLPEDQYNVIVWTYKYHYSNAKLAGVLEITEDAARMRVNRAVKKISATLSGMAPSTSEGADPEYIGSRKVMTNATARAITSSQWD